MARGALLNPVCPCIMWDEVVFYLYRTQIISGRLSSSYGVKVKSFEELSVKIFASTHRSAISQLRP